MPIACDRRVSSIIKRVLQRGKRLAVLQMTRRAVSSIADAQIKIVCWRGDSYDPQTGGQRSGQEKGEKNLTADIARKSLRRLKMDKLKAVAASRSSGNQFVEAPRESDSRAGGDGTMTTRASRSATCKAAMTAARQLHDHDPKDATRD